MSCFYPVECHILSLQFRGHGLKSVIHDLRQVATKDRDKYFTKTRPCKVCTRCRLDHSVAIATRCVHQASMSNHNSFLTLTYSDENLPADLSLSTRTMQLFWKKLRKKLNMPGLKYYASGEYGDGDGTRDINPHYHACVFGYDFPDKKFHKKTKNGDNLYLSDLLSEKWELGYCPIGDVTFESAAYVARYTMKKIYGQTSDGLSAEEYYQGRLPEKSWSSNGLAKSWFEKWKDDVYPSDQVVMFDGRVLRPPPYYDQLLLAHDPDLWEEIQNKRVEKQIISKNNFTITKNPATNRPISVSDAVLQSKLKTHLIDQRR